ERLFDQDRLLRVVEALLRSSEESAWAPDKGPILLADLSSALHHPMVPMTPSQVYSLIFKNKDAVPSTRLSFLSEAVEAFRSVGARSVISITAMTASPESRQDVGVDASNEYTASAVAPWLLSRTRAFLH